MARQSRLQVTRHAYADDMAPEVRRLADADEIIGDLVRSIGPYRLQTDSDAWGVLVAAVVYQQISGKAAAAICARLAGPARRELPRPQAVAEAAPGTWQRAGLTAKKETTLRSLATAVLDGDLDFRSLAGESDDVVIAALTEFSGVGPWTARMWLVFHLGRSDIVFPNDLGLRKAVAFHYGLKTLPSERDVIEIASRWAPARTIATWYLWKSLPGFPEPGFALPTAGRA